MSDKKFVTIISGTLVSLIIIFYLLALFLPEERYMDDEYPSWLQQRDYISTKGSKQEVLLLGDSRIKVGVLATKLGENTYNLALGGGSPIEMYYTLKTYLNHHPAPKAIIISFGPIHYTQMASYTARGMYFHYYDDETIKYVNSVIYKMDGKDLTSDAKMFKYRLPNVYMQPILKSIIKPRTRENRDLYERARKEKGRLFRKNEHNERKSVYIPESKDKGFIPLKSLTFFMEEIIQLCQNNNIPVYVEQTPMGNPGYQKLKENGYFTDYKTYLKAFQEKFRIPINYDVPLYEAQYFQDASHLNIKGAQKYTLELRNKYPQIFKE